MRPRSQHCIDNHGDAERRDGQGHCAQCRRDWTKAQQIEKRQAVREHKLVEGCADCGYADDPRRLHFHHRDPATKTLTISAATNYGWARLWAEVAKCEVLCAPCHTLRHHPHLAQTTQDRVSVRHT